MMSRLALDRKTDRKKIMRGNCLQQNITVTTQSCRFLEFFSASCTRKCILSQGRRESKRGGGGSS